MNYSCFPVEAVEAEILNHLQAIAEEEIDPSLKLDRMAEVLKIREIFKNDSFAMKEEEMRKALWKDEEWDTVFPCKDKGW